jgi:hypothetical protein
MERLLSRALRIRVNNLNHLLRSNNLNFTKYTRSIASLNLSGQHQILPNSLNSTAYFNQKNQFHTTIRCFENKNDPPDDSADNPNDPSSTSPPPIPPPLPTMNALAPIQIPDVFPKVPLVAVARNPLFPRFVKMLEITNKDLIDLIRRKVNLNMPFIGIFLRRDEK